MTFSTSDFPAPPKELLKKWRENPSSWTEDIKISYQSGFAEGYKKAMADRLSSIPDSETLPQSIFSFWLDLLSEDPLKACLLAWQDGYDRGRNPDPVKKALALFDKSHQFQPQVGMPDYKFSHEEAELIRFALQQAGEARA